MRVRTAVPTVAGGIAGVLVVAGIWSAIASVNTAARFPVIPAIIQATIDNFSAAPILAYTTFGTGESGRTSCGRHRTFCSVWQRV